MMQQSLTDNSTLSLSAQLCCKKHFLCICGFTSITDPIVLMFRTSSVLTYSKIISLTTPLFHLQYSVTSFILISLGQSNIRGSMCYRTFSCMSECDTVSVSYEHIPVSHSMFRVNDLQGQYGIPFQFHPFLGWDVFALLCFNKNSRVFVTQVLLCHVIN